jgi:hypothetical protein
MTQYVSQLGLLLPHIQRHSDSADSNCGAEQLYELRAIAHQQCDSVTLDDSAVLESRRKVLHAAVEICISQRLT